MSVVLVAVNIYLFVAVILILLCAAYAFLLRCKRVKNTEYRSYIMMTCASFVPWTGVTLNTFNAERDEPKDEVIEKNVCEVLDSHQKITQPIESKEHMESEEALKKSELSIKQKLESLLLADGDIGDLSLGDILDYKAIQSMMDDFYKTTKMGVGILDNTGKVLVSIGWQDICRKFHRVHPKTCRYCVESDLILSKGVPAGEFKLYKCRNNMWDMATPIIINGRHLGNVFCGQFLFEDEAVDYDLFREQARKYGFDEKKYIEALEKVPHWSREKVNFAMSFYIKLANMISIMSFRNIQLARSEAKNKALINAIPDMMVTFSREGKIIGYKEGCTDELYVRPEEFMGKSIEEVFPENIADLTYEKIREAKETGQVQVYEYMLDVGGLKYYEARLVPCDGDTFLAIVRNISIRKLMEKALYEEKKLLETTLLSVGDGVISTDEKGNVKLLNRVAEQLTGWSQDDACGKPLEKVLNLVNDFFRKKCENYLQRVVETGEIVELSNNTTLVSKEGIERSIEYCAAPISNEDGENIGVVLVLRDFTEKKKKQENIEYLSFHDQLTGLYNRRFYEEVTKRLDVEENLPISLIMADVNGLKLINDVFGHLVGDKLLKKGADIIKKECRSKDIIARIGGDELVILLPETDSKEAESIVKRIRAAISKEKVDSVELSISFGWATKTDTGEEMEAVFKKAEDYMYRRKLLESPSMRGNTIKTIINVMHEKFAGEKEHSERVSLICEAIGTEMGLGGDDITELRTAGLLHDIGKITLDQSLLHKPGKLSDQEFNELKRHPETGYRILSSVNHMAQLAEYTLAHHERWDGTGYPKGLKEREIPLKSRIIAVADAYDAMTNDRSYRKALSREQAMEELKRNAGTQFDPDVVHAFLLSRGRFF